MSETPTGHMLDYEAWLEYTGKTHGDVSALGYHVYASEVLPEEDDELEVVVHTETISAFRPVAKVGAVEAHMVPGWNNGPILIVEGAR